jgi:hypothetical protein
MKSEIIHWLNNPNRDYNAGVKLYAEIERPTFLFLFQKQENQFTRSKLIDELKKYTSSFEIELPDVLNVKQSLVRHFEPKKKIKVISREDLPEELQKLDIKKGQLYAEMSEYHKELRRTADGDQFNAARLELAKKIVYIDEVISLIWQQLDYFRDHGELMPNAPQIYFSLEQKAEGKEDYSKLTEAELIKKKLSAVQMRSRYKRQGKIDKMKEFEAIVDELNQLLDAYKK